MASHILLFPFVTFRARFWPHLGQVPGVFIILGQTQAHFLSSVLAPSFTLYKEGGHHCPVPCRGFRSLQTAKALVAAGCQSLWTICSHCPTPLLLGTEAGNKMYHLAGQVTSLLVSYQVTQIIFMAVDTWHSQREF